MRLRRLCLAIQRIVTCGKRISSDDATVRMPPVDSHRKPLTATQIATIQQWIKEGAEWGRHWAFEAPERPSLPDAVSNGSVHPIDALVLPALAEEGLELAPTADPITLARRVSFDLNGLPPDRAVVAAMASAPDELGYQDFVNGLLKSPHYGERMAMWWLDAARYSDTDGYQQDATRTNWPWRDWVIGAFNQNMPL